MKMQKLKNVFEANSEEDWITIKGTHVKIEEGQSKEETAENFIESHENKQNNEQKGKDGQTPKKEEKDENSPKLDKNKPPPDEEAAEIKKAEEEAITEKKQKWQEQLSKDVDAVLNGTYKESHVTLLNHTPKILQDIGMADKPMLITAKHVYTCVNESGKYTGKDITYHDLGADFIKQVPTLLESPKLVFKNKSKNNEVVVVVDAVDKKGRPVIVPILMNGVGRQNSTAVRANIIKSIYGRNNFNSYIKTHATTETILYKKQEIKEHDKQKIEKQIEENNKKEPSK